MRSFPFCFLEYAKLFNQSVGSSTLRIIPFSTISSRQFLISSLSWIGHFIGGSVTMWYSPWNAIVFVIWTFCSSAWTAQCSVTRSSCLKLGKPRIPGPSVSTRKNFVSYQRPWLYWQGIITTPWFMFRCMQWIWCFDVSHSVQVLGNRLLLDILDAFDDRCEERVCHPVHQCLLSAWVCDFQVLNQVWCSVWWILHRVCQHCWSLFQQTTCVENVQPCTLLIVPW